MGFLPISVSTVGRSCQGPGDSYARQVTRRESASADTAPGGAQTHRGIPVLGQGITLVRAPTPIANFTPPSLGSGDLRPIPAAPGGCARIASGTRSGGEGPLSTPQVAAAEKGQVIPGQSRRAPTCGVSPRHYAERAGAGANQSLTPLGASSSLSASVISARSTPSTRATPSPYAGSAL